MQRKLKIIRELLTFFATNSHWWLLPLVIVLIFIAVLILFGESSVIAPLVYPLF